jgi:hypothetical protein
MDCDKIWTLFSTGIFGVSLCVVEFFAIFPESLLLYWNMNHSCYTVCSTLFWAL